MANDSFDADVLVLGGGPAGNNAALELSRRGHRVIVVDRRRDLGDKLCTGIVSAECIKSFPAEPAHVRRAARSAMVFSPLGNTIHVERPEPQAYILDRVAYVASFAKRAQTAGATYLLEHTVESVDIHRDRVTVTVSNTAGARSMRARATVVACGFGSRVPAMAGLGSPKDFVTGAQVEVFAPNVPEVEVYVGRSYAPGFFAWTAPTSQGRALVGLMARRQAGELLDQLVERLKNEGKVNEAVRAPRKWGIPLKPISRTYGERVIAVGDAAGQVKPATGGGIYYSLLASRMAAETLDEALRKDDLRPKALSSYERSWKAVMRDDMEVAYAARRMLDTLGDNQVDYLMRKLGNSEAAQRLWESPSLSFDWHGRFIKTMVKTPMMRGAFRALDVVLPKGVAR
ncbi:MAG: NAD(P)/FAD-dependent oxidoreductase [Chloroflexi bacterium]|nr:NAD(P)/FAD-dependent oxidoreductase [Chloroflexota bacterium]